MKLTALLDPKLIRCGLQARTRDEAFRELVGLLEGIEPSLSKEAVVEALRARDSLAPTVHGEVALPHARTDAVREFHVLIGTAPDGFDYGGQTVRVIAVFLVPKQSSALYLQTLAQLARIAADRDLIRCMAHATAPAGVIGCVESKGFVVKTTITAADLLSPNPPTVMPDATMKEVVDRMRRERLLELAVVERGRFLGVLHMEDILRVGLPDSLQRLESLDFLTSFEPFSEILQREEETKVEAIYSREAPVVSPDTPLIRVALLLARLDVRAVYVVDEEGILQGTVESQDLVSKILRP
ncbi:MAG: PTS sugar transporter subunit IIA [Planctomycetes bacterium]|nr:PTS sugar transporter subunit IIA [Planctomycetota bacterium]